MPGASRRSAAVVPRRRAWRTPGGSRTHCRKPGWRLCRGSAPGIDGAAHRGALTGRGSAITVIGTGAGPVYPAAHPLLARQIAAGGAMDPEWPPGTPARAASFPPRNRRIAGLVGGVTDRRGRDARRVAHHRTPRERNGARRVRAARLDPRATVARMPQNAQTRRETGRDARGNTRRAWFRCTAAV